MPPTRTQIIRMQRSFKADIHALLVMNYQMLTGELPFKHEHRGALLMPTFCTRRPMRAKTDR